MPQPNKVKKISNERDIETALRAIQQDANLTVPRAAVIYKVSESTLRRRRAGTRSRRTCTPNLIKLLKTEEEVIVAHILNLDERGWAPRLAAVKDMADCLLAERHRDPVGQNWAASFVKRRPELKVKFNRKYDYKRALCEDPEIIQGWFRLVQNMRVKYGILDDDMYNFDEAGFMIGVISTGAVVTRSDRQGRAKMLQQGN